MKDPVAYPKDSVLAPAMLPHDTPEERAALEGVLQFHYEQAERAKWVRALGWFTNASFVAGNHYPNFHWNGTSMSWDSPTLPRTKASALIPKTSDNHIVRAHEAAVSRLTEFRPQPRVQPNSDAPDDEDATRLAEIAYRVKYEDLRMHPKLRGLAGYLSTCGTAAMEVAYDDIDEITEVPTYRRVKRPDILAEDDDEAEFETDEPTGETTAAYEKDLVAKLWSGFHLIPDPAATNDPSSLTWLARENFEDLSWLKEQFDRDEEGFYPENLEKVECGSYQSVPLYWWERLKDLLDSPETHYGLSSRTANGKIPNQVLFRVMDTKPNLRFPRGRTIITAGDKLLYCGQARAWDERYRWRWHPYAIFRYWTLVGRFWGIPLVSMLVPLQRRVNAIDALVQLNREYMTIGQWLLPTACKVPDGTLTGVPGKSIPYKTTPSGAKPEKVKHEGLPSELIGEREMMVRRIEVLSGIRQNSEIEAQSAVRAGVMLDFYQREKLQSQSSMLADFGDNHEVLAQNVLIEISRNFDRNDDALTRRLRAAAAEESELAIRTFTGKDLRDHVHVRIDIASALMRSPEAQKELAIGFAQARGQNMSDEEAQRVWRQIGFEEFDRQQGPQVRRAKRMIARVVQGMKEAAVPLPVDNPSVFTQVLTNAMISDKFNDYTIEVKEQILFLFDHYQGVIQAQQQAQRQQQILDAALIAQAEKGIAPKPPEGAAGGDGKKPAGEKKASGGKKPSSSRSSGKKPAAPAKKAA